MLKIAVIGAGISGLSTAHFLKENNMHVVVFEKETTSGGLIRCRRINGSLFHICGGHVFNSKKKDVLDWFWSHFDEDKDFVRAERNASVIMDGKTIPYPIENNFFLFEEHTQKSIISDLLSVHRDNEKSPQNFKEFLNNTFGKTLYEKYFEPYNEKIWQSDLSDIPLSWLEGKLPTPSVSEMFFNNVNRIAEKTTVHSTFWYEKNNGSQFIADSLSKEIDVRYSCEITEIRYVNHHWIIGGEDFDKVIFCGNIKELPYMLRNTDIDLSGYYDAIEGLKYHGTTAVFCEIDPNPFSWIYIPDKSLRCHRIICTGNFAPSNNSDGKMTGTVEFTDEISIEDIKMQLSRAPFHPKYLTHHFSEYTYPIQDSQTRRMIESLKGKLSSKNLYFTGRFADWEYYNMDIAIAAAKKTVNNIIGL